MICMPPGPRVKSKNGPPLEFVDSANPRSVHADQNGSHASSLYSFTPGRLGAGKLRHRSPFSRAHFSVSIDASMSQLGMYTRQSSRSGSSEQKSANQRL